MNEIYSGFMVILVTVRITGFEFYNLMEVLLEVTKVTSNIFALSSPV